MGNLINMPNVDDGTGKIIDFHIGVNGNQTYNVESEAENFTLNDVLTAIGTAQVITTVNMMINRKENLRERIKEGNSFDEKDIEIYAKNVVEKEVAPCYNMVADIISNSTINYLMNSIVKEEDPVLKMYLIKVIETYTNVSLKDLVKDTNFEDKI